MFTVPESATVKVEITKGIVAKVTIAGATLSALRSCGTSRQGTTTRGTFAAEALAELEGLGLIGPGGGLTRRGSFAYLDVQEQTEKAMGF